MSTHLYYIKQTSNKSIRSLSCICVNNRRFYSTKTNNVNHYDILGINSNATHKEIKAAFYKLSKKHHPDVNPHDLNAAKDFSIISNAYDILSDPVRRRDYDNELLSKSGPHVTYNPTSSYAQRARAHRPSSWKPPTPSANSSGGFPGSENAFGSSQNTNYGTFDKEQYDSAFGRYRGPLRTGRSTVYDFDEFYRSHYSDFKNWSTILKEAKQRMHQQKQQEERKRQERANRSTLSRVSTWGMWITLGFVSLFVANILHDMHFQKPTEEFRAKFYLINNSTTNRDSSSSKS